MGKLWGKGINVELAVQNETFKNDRRDVRKRLNTNDGIAYENTLYNNLTQRINETVKNNK